MMNLKRRNPLNKKGFTLIELLAVIVILGLLMLLASSSIVAMLQNAKKSAFAIEGQNVIEQAKMSYTDAMLNGNLVGSHFCMSVTYLKAHGLTKDDAAFNGSVEIKVTGDIASYKIWLTSGSLQLNGIDRSSVNKESVVESAEAVSVDCDGDGTLVG